VNGRISPSFRQLESESDQHLVAASGDSTLEIWYRSIRDCPIDQLSLLDLSRACRQQLFPDSIVPVAVNVLACESDAGHIYDFELLLSMLTIPRNFWDQHSNLSSQLLPVAEYAVGKIENDVERGRVESLIEHLRQIGRVL
jgi:CDI immunity proteins